MRWFAFILSLYILAMSCIPCTDEQTTLDENNQSISLFSVDQDPPVEQPDLCSPLCICSCCGGFVVTYVSTSLTNAPLFKEDMTAIYKQDFISKLSSTIWQPPKI